MAALPSQPPPDSGREPPTAPAPVADNPDPARHWEGYDVAILDALLDG